MVDRIKVFLFAFSISFSSLSCGLCSYYDFQWVNDATYFGAYFRYTLKNGYSYKNDPHQFFVQGNFSSAGMRINHQLPDELEVDETRKDYHRSIFSELRGNLNLGEKINITFYFPYETSILYYERILESSGTARIRDTTIEYSGWGEFTGRFQYTFTIPSENYKHILKPSVGLKVKKNKTEVNQLQTFQVDHTILPGAGIPEYFLGFFYTVKRGNSGLRLQTYRGWCRENNEEYKYGDQWLAGIDFTYFFGSEKVAINPYAGSFWEYRSADREYGKILPDTGGYSLQANFGCSASIGNVDLNILYQHPITDHLLGAQMGISGRVNSGVTLTF